MSSRIDFSQNGPARWHRVRDEDANVYNIGLDNLGGLLGEGPFLSSIAAYRIDRTAASGQWLFVVSACLETIQSA